MKPNVGGSLTLYIRKGSPSADKKSNRLPEPRGTFLLSIRCCWAEQAVLDDTGPPPKVEQVR